MRLAWTEARLPVEADAGSVGAASLFTSSSWLQLAMFASFLAPDVMRLPPRQLLLSFSLSIFCSDFNDAIVAASEEASERVPIKSSHIARRSFLSSNRALALSLVVCLRLLSHRNNNELSPAADCLCERRRTKAAPRDNLAAFVQVSLLSETLPPSGGGAHMQEQRTTGAVGIPFERLPLVS